MTFSPADHLHAISRTLSTTTRDGVPMRKLTATRTYEAEPAEVWDALTTAERISRWLGPISGDLVVGGRFQVEGNAGGEILDCAPAHRIAVTWENFGSVSWVDVTLTPASGGTTLVLEHTAEVPEDLWAQFGPGAVGIGWDMTLMGLAEHLAAPSAPAPTPENMPDLAGFMTGSSEAWCEASIASGTDQGQAQAAASAVLAMYLGTPTSNDA